MSPVIIPEKTLPESLSTEHSSIVDIPLNAKMLEVFIDRTYLTDPTLACGVQIFISFDAGLSWKPWGGFGTQGGILKNDTLQTAAKSGVGVTLPYPENGNRKIMVTLTATKEAKTSVQYEIIE